MLTAPEQVTGLLPGADPRLLRGGWVEAPRPLLTVEDLTVEYTLGSHVSRVLDRLSFTARSGELVATK